jgi:hypothetical protein
MFGFRFDLEYLLLRLGEPPGFGRLGGSMPQAVTAPALGYPRRFLASEIGPSCGVHRRGRSLPVPVGPAAAVAATLLCRCRATQAVIALISPATALTRPVTAVISTEISLVGFWPWPPPRGAEAPCVPMANADISMMTPAHVNRSPTIAVTRQCRRRRFVFTIVTISPMGPARNKSPSAPAGRRSPASRGAPAAARNRRMLRTGTTVPRSPRSGRPAAARSRAWTSGLPRQAP